MQHPGRADIPALVRRLQGGSVAEQALATLALNHLWESGGSSRPGIGAAITGAGGIPALVQLIGSHGENPCVAHAVWLLGSLALGSPARCQAIMAADGIEPLVRCLESGSQARLQATAAGALANIAGSDGGGEAGKAAIAAANGIPAAVRLLSSRDDGELKPTALLLRNLSSSSEQRLAVAAAGGIPPLVRLLRRPNQAVVVNAATAVFNLTCSPDNEPSVVAVEAAGGIRLLVELAATSSDDDVVAAALGTVRNMLPFSTARIAAAVVEAGGIPALVRCLRIRQFSSMTHVCAATCLVPLARGAQPSQAISDAGGVPALVQALARPNTPRTKFFLAWALSQLLVYGQAAAVAAADPSNAVAAALEWMPSSSSPSATPQTRADVTEALRLLAAARVCAAPGCGATAGLKRCAGCGSVRYCSEACMRAHWREHRPECKRLRAAAAAAGGAGPPSS